MPVVPVPADFIGTIPGWITSAGVVGLLWIVVNGGLGWRKQGLENQADIRDHYADEVTALRAHMATMEGHWRSMVKSSDERHAECERDRKILRDEIHDLQDMVRGFRRQLAQYSTDRLMELEGLCPSDKAPEAAASAERVRRIVEGGDDGHKR